MKPFDTDRTPWLFTPRDDGELDAQKEKPLATRKGRGDKREDVSRMLPKLQS